MRSRNVINLFASFTFLAATATAGLAVAADAPTVSRPSSSAVSPNLADLPTAHWAQGQDLKLVPAPKPLPPRKAGPGGASLEDKALQRQEGPHLGDQPKSSNTRHNIRGSTEA